MVITALFLFTGGVLGFRFKVLILVPAIVLTVVVTGSIEIAQGQDAWFISADYSSGGDCDSDGLS